MKKLLIAGLIAASAFSAHADGRRHGHGGHHSHSHNNWVLPALITGAVVYSVTRPPVVVQQPPVVQYENCGPWRETLNYDGSITRTRICQ